MNRDPFDSFRAFENDVLDGLRNGERSAKKFKQLMGTINDTLVTTHGLVIGRLHALKDAPDVATARDLLEGLRAEELTEAFRVEGLCDLLHGLGEGLRSRALDAKEEGLFRGDQLDGVYEFAWLLYDKEREVARVYAESLIELVNQGPGLDDASLDGLRSEAATALSRLTNDVSDFEAKAKIFKQVSLS